MLADFLHLSGSQIEEKNLIKFSESIKTKPYKALIRVWMKIMDSVAVKMVAGGVLRDL